MTQQQTTWHVHLLTLFPEMFPGPLGHSLSGKAFDQKLWSYKAINIRDFTEDVHKTVDDTPYGGGAGMVMRADIIEKALLSIQDPGHLIYMSPRGIPLTQTKTKQLAELPALTILCGRYEGIDQRILDAYPFEEISIGDYVLSGGEPAALTLMDSCIRLLPGVMGNDHTAEEESFSPETGGLLEYPHYTRPASWQSQNGQNYDVPDILTSGDHGKIEKWRQEQALKITKARRPDLVKNSTS